MLQGGSGIELLEDLENRQGKLWGVNKLQDLSVMIIITMR